MNERIMKLREQYLSNKPEICIERAQIITKAYENFKNEPVEILRAKSLDKILKDMTIYIRDGELIVGNQSTKPRSAPVYPEFSSEWILKELDRFENRKAGKYYITEENKAVLRKILPDWKNVTTMDKALAIIPERNKTAMNSKAFILTPLSSGLGHISVDYKKVIDVGLNGIINEIQEHINNCDLEGYSDIDRINFYISCKIACKAVINFAQRYADLAKELAKSASLQRREELLEIARICEKVPRYRAENFQEASQSFWFIHLCLQIESNGHSVSPGRFDQYMYRCYEADVNAGTAPEKMEEMLECLWIKFNEINKLRDELGSIAFGGYPMFQNLIIGGIDKEGNDCTNDLSILCCKVTRNLKLSQPSLSVRWHKNSPKELMVEAAEVVRCGIGMPAYFNDEIIIPVLLNIGCSLEDARDYAEVGCVEPHPAGKCEGMYSAGFDNLCKILELTLFNGVDPVTKQNIGIKTGTEFATFEDFYEAYLKQQAYILKLHAQAVNIVDYVHSIHCPTPFVSCLTDDCITKGVDIRRGGAHYNFTSPNAVGLANLADALAVIEQKVFVEKKYTMKQLREFISSDYKEFERIRQELLNDVPKYGNDNEQVDRLARRVGEDYCLEFKKFKNIRNGTFQPGLQSISAHALFVDSIHATPDGRTSNMLVSDGGISPAQGRDKLGPTAVIKSAAKLNHLEATNGALLNIKFHPSTLEGEKGLLNIITLVDGFFGSGGQHVQFNVVSKEMLIDAQKHPKRYGDLVVRVAGFSVLFITLDALLQNDIIERTEHTF